MHYKTPGSDLTWQGRNAESDEGSAPTWRGGAKLGEEGGYRHPLPQLENSGTPGHKPPGIGIATCKAVSSPLKPIPANPSWFTSRWYHVWTMPKRV